MNFRNPESNQSLAAEYVLGTLRGPARRRFERALEGSEELRWEVAFWEQRLGDFASQLPPVTPPPAARLALQQAIAGAAVPAGPHSHRRGSRRRRPVRYVLVAASAVASMALAAVLVQRSAPETRPVSAAAREPMVTAGLAPARHAAATGAAARPDAVPMYVTALAMPTSTMRWLISLAPDRRSISVVASDDYLQAGRASLQLWWMSRSRGPVALGLMPTARDASSDIAVPEDFDGDEQITFAITIEPEGGSRTGRPGVWMTDTEPSGSV